MHELAESLVRYGGLASPADRVPRVSPYIDNDPYIITAYTIESSTWPMALPEKES